LAAPVFETEAAGAVDRDRAAAVLYGLYWLLAGVAERRPVLLLVDDAHWLDPASARFVVYLARRVTSLPVLLVVGLRTGERAGVVGLDAELGELAASVLRPALLSKRRAPPSCAARSGHGRTRSSVGPATKPRAGIRSICVSWQSRSGRTRAVRRLRVRGAFVLWGPGGSVAACLSVLLVWGLIVSVWRRRWWCSGRVVRCVTRQHWRICSVIAPRWPRTHCELSSYWHRVQGCRFCIRSSARRSGLSSRHRSVRHCTARRLGCCSPKARRAIASPRTCWPLSRMAIVGW